MIDAKSLHKTYRIGFFRKRVEAVRDISLKVEEGDLFGFIGPNGAGKSTTIKMLLGLIQPDGGQATLLGKMIGTPESRREVGFLPEQPYFYDYLTGLEFLRYYSQVGSVPKNKIGNRIEAVTHLTGIKKEWLERKLRTYSKGMLQRFGLAQSLLAEPRLLILDEPMSGLDPLGRRDVRELLKSLHRQGVTIFYSSHVLGDVEAICTRVAMVVRGELRRHGTVEEVLGNESPSYRFTFEKELPPNAIPVANCLALDGHHVEASSGSARNELLQWAVSQGLAIQGLERRRASLEDVLTQEVMRPE